MPTQREAAIRSTATLSVASQPILGTNPAAAQASAKCSRCPTSIITGSDHSSPARSASSTSARPASGCDADSPTKMGSCATGV